METEQKDLELLEEEDDIVELEDEDGNVLNFYHIATFPFEGKDYVVFQPAEKYDVIEEDEVVIYELKTDENGEDSYEFIEDDELLDKVFDEFLRLVEEANEEDGECKHSCEGCSGCGH